VLIEAASCSRGAAAPGQVPQLTVVGRVAARAGTPDIDCGHVARHGRANSRTRLSLGQGRPGLMPLRLRMSDGAPIPPSARRPARAAYLLAASGVTGASLFGIAAARRRRSPGCPAERRPSLAVSPRSSRRSLAAASPEKPVAVPGRWRCGSVPIADVPASLKIGSMQALRPWSLLDQCLTIRRAVGSKRDRLVVVGPDFSERLGGQVPHLADADRLVHGR
jgi:hypothetical protein